MTEATAPEAQVAVDDAEFSEFFASQYGPLCWLGLLLTGSRTQAEELAQEALVRTWWRWKLVRWPDDPASHARRVLVNRDLTEAQVARLLGLPLGTMKSLGHRALARLRQQLGSPSLDPASSKEGR